jgi:acetate kinase
MNDAIIVLNAGSSSLKFSIYTNAEQKLSLWARGQIEGLGSAPRFKAIDGRGQKLVDESLLESGARFGHAEAYAHLAQWLRRKSEGSLLPVAVGHRVGHGGLDFVDSVLIDTDILGRLETLIPLVPLHQPHNLAAIKAVAQLRPDLPQVACFDTAFHRGRPKVTEQFGLPDEMFQQGVRRWGFHGLSYESISAQLKQIAPSLWEGRTIVAHLGSGASLCAMRHGRSVDTTMSFSALDGLPMGTRCGALDPGVVLFFLHRQMSPAQIEELLYKKSGLLGISGISNDVRELLQSDNPRASEAIDYFVHRVVREIGALAAVLGGFDGLVFTAGIGENAPEIRSGICRQLAWLGVELDEGANATAGPRISAAASRVSVWVIGTNEELVIAQHTRRLLENWGPEQAL